MIVLLVVAVYVATLALMLGVDWLTGGVIADAFGKEWPFHKRGEG